MQLFSGIKDKISEYFEVKLKLFQIDIENRISDLISNMVFVMLLMSISTIGFLFFLLFIAHIINSFAHNQYLGYGFVTSLCLILLAILTRDKFQVYIKTKIKEKIILTIKKQQNGDEDSHSI